jgi:hypothetical protein
MRRGGRQGNFEIVGIETIAGKNGTLDSRLLESVAQGPLTPTNEVGHE